LPFVDASRMWLVIVITGMGVGLTGAWLDVLVKWSVDEVCFGSILATDGVISGWLIFEKATVYMDSSTISRRVVVDLMVCRFLLLVLDVFDSPVVIPAGEICTDWKSWGQYLNIQIIIGQSLLHSFVYVALAVSNIILTLITRSNLKVKVVFAGSAAILVQFYAP